jgi:hypothetical protein
MILRSYEEGLWSPWIRLDTRNLRLFEDWGSCLVQMVWRIPEKLRREIATLGSPQP